VNSFYLARFPVTNGAWHEFIQAGGYRDARYWTQTGWAWAQAHRREFPHRWGDNVWRDTPDHPVQWLTWYEAMAYARWMALQTGAPYRLPTEAEWEKAASWDPVNRIKREYPWGDSFDWSFCNLRGQWTTPVGSHSPRGDTPDGLADMAGQVWQWTSSRRLPYPYKPDVAREDPEAEGERAMRGGCWANQSPEDARCTGRYPGSVWPTMNTNASYEGPCGLRLALGFTGREL
jgi:formylglycine-generating enzyme required for sulfatase activity